MTMILNSDLQVCHDAPPLCLSCMHRRPLFADCKDIGHSLPAEVKINNRLKTVTKVTHHNHMERKNKLLLVKSKVISIVISISYTLQTIIGDKLNLVTLTFDDQQG